MDIRTVQKECNRLATEAKIPLPIVKYTKNNQYNAYSISGKYLKSKRDEIVVTNRDLQNFSQDRMRVVLAHEIGHLIISHRNQSLKPCIKAILDISPSEKRSAIVDAIIMFIFMTICIITLMNVLGHSFWACVAVGTITFIPTLLLLHIMSLLHTIHYFKWMAKDKRAQRILKTNRKIELKADYYSIKLTNEPEVAIDLLKFLKKETKKLENDKKKNRWTFLRNMVFKKADRIYKKYHLNDHPQYNIRIKAIQRLER